jgi:hypothetical protein
MSTEITETQMETSERMAREILNTLHRQHGSLHRLRAAYELMRCAEALIEACHCGNAGDWQWQSLGDVATRVVEKIKPNDE